MVRGGVISGELEAEVPYITRAYLGTAKSLAFLGRNDEAICHYRTFIDLWKHCDPELQPMVDEVRARLASLLAAKG